MPLTVNPNVRAVRCSRTGAPHPTDFSSPLGLCRCCPGPGAPLVVEYDLPAVGRSLRDIPPPGRGIWRWAPLLPIHGVDDAYAADVGDTAIVRQERLSAELGVEVFLKSEGQNPSGSFKDRGLAVAVALGAALGARRFCLPTQGNAGVAACLFSARAGLEPCIVYMPEGYQQSVYHRACELFGGEVRFAGGNIAASGRAMREELAATLAAGETVELSTFFEPGRLEGKKTMGLEIAGHFGPHALPDVIVYPTGGGTGLVGIWKAIEELVALGLGDAGAPRPRMVAVQAERCAPVVRSFEAGLDHVEPVVSEGTIADGLDVPGAIMGHGILRAIRESGGTAVAVAEAAIVEAFRHYGRLGVAAGYESAATLAGLEALRARGDVARGERVLLLNTGTQLVALARS